MNIFELNGQGVLWAGSEESFDIVVKAQRMVEAAMLAGTLKAPTLEAGAMTDAQGLPAIWEKQGGTAIVNIAGSLIDGSAGWMRLFAPVIGYDDIANAAIAAYSDPEVQRVMVRIESPGGQVSGVMDCGNLLNQISGMKPSMAYTSNQMCSGGYWLGSSIQGDIVAGQTAEVGSIGVVMVHTDVSKALADQGIKKTVMRSGDNKARLNPIEPLTPEVQAKVEQAMADVHAIFNAQVAKARPGMSAEQLAAATDGSTFLGKRAKSAGLVDKIASYSQALKLLDSQNPTSNTPSNSKGVAMKVQLTQAQIDQIAAGAAVTAIGLSAEDATALQAQIDADAAATAATQASADAAATAATAAAASKDGTGGAAPAAEVAELNSKLVGANAQIDLLKSQLVTAQAEVSTKSAELLAANVQVSTMKANHDGLLAIARTATGKMAIALGGTSAAAETMDASGIVAEHARIDGIFKEKFKVGGVSKNATETDQGKGKDAPDPTTRAFLHRASSAQQTRLAKSK